MLQTRSEPRAGTGGSTHGSSCRGPAPPRPRGSEPQQAPCSEGVWQRRGNTDLGGKHSPSLGRAEISVSREAPRAGWEGCRDRGCGDASLQGCRDAGLQGNRATVLQGSSAAARRGPGPAHNVPAGRAGPRVGPRGRGRPPLPSPISERLSRDVTFSHASCWEGTNRRVGGRLVGGAG